MSAPSFTSFPASFSSFPDTGPAPGPSSHANTTRDIDAAKPRKKKHRDESRESESRERSARKDGKDRKDDEGRDEADESNPKRKRKTERRKERDATRSQVRHERHKQQKWENKLRLRKAEATPQASDRDASHTTEPKSSADHAYYDTGASVLDSRPLFIVDRKGDHLNVRYGTPNSSDIPRFCSIAGGRKILGLSNAFMVLHRSNKGVEVGVGSWTRRKMPVLTDSSSRKLLHAPPQKRLLAGATNQYRYDEIGGFLRLPSHRPKPSHDPSYRAITREAASDSSSSASEQDDSASESDDDQDTVLTAQQETTRELERRLADDPEDVGAWLALRAHLVSHAPPNSKDARRARAEVSLSVLERARSARVSNKRAPALLLPWLGAGEDVWPPERLDKEWEAALKGEVGAEVVMAWLDWRVKAAREGVEGVVKDGERAMGMVKSEVAALRVFWRVAVALQHAGYVERATAMFQAQAELTFEIPQSLYGLPLEALLDALEDFWDSDTPRVGDPGATGWSAHNPSSSPPAPPQPTSPPPPSTEKDPYARWAADECAADLAQRTPVRGEGGADDDPYAAVFFSDVRPLLRTVGTPEGRRAFRLLFLHFLGLPIPGLVASLSQPTEENTDCTERVEDEKWGSTHLSSPSSLLLLFPSPAERRAFVTSESHAGVIVGAERSYTGSALGTPVREWAYGALGPLESPEAHAKFGLWRTEDVQGVDVGFVRRVFERLREGEGDEEWDGLGLAFEAAINLKGALKLSKSFLATLQDSFTHWSYHARLERLRGRPSDARKVYQTVLTASSPDSTASKPGAAQLWYDWAETEWLAGDNAKALAVAMHAAGVKGEGAAAVLRAKRALDDQVRESEEEGARTAWMRLRALLELVVGTPEVMLAVYDRHAPSTSVPAQQEQALMHALLMLYHHTYTLRHPTPPALLRDRAHDALARFPANTVFLGLVLESEKGQGVWGRVRAVLGEGERGEKGVVRRVAEVWVARWERGRWEAEKERVRSGLGIALDGERLRGSPVVWRILLELEIRDGQLERAKKMLFRAVAECPLCKELYLLAFGPLRAVFKPRELDGWAETMAERGIRMRKGLDEVLETVPAIRSREVDDDGTMDYGEEDVEERADVLRRLRPY